MPFPNQLIVETAHFKNRRTLILGEVDCGKTHYTEKVLEAFIAEDLAPQTSVLDLAPQRVGRIGGKMTSADRPPVLYLTEAIVAPRVTAKTDQEAEKLALGNAQRIEKLFARFCDSGRRILFINDASLYLQAGSLQKLALLLQMTDTAVINAYYGDTFAPSPLTRREKAATERLRALCDKHVHLSKKDSS